MTNILHLTTRAFAVAFILLLQSGSLCAAEVTPGYGGAITDESGQARVYTNIALRLVQEGVYAYKYTFGIWPDSWQSVRDSGLCQVSLISPEGLSIDPDDGTLDFMWDVSYIRAEDYFNLPKTLTIMDINGPYVSTDPFEQISSLEEIVAKMPAERATKYTGLLNNTDWRIMAGIRRYFNRMLVHNRRVRSDWPGWQDFVNSEWTPVGYQSVNPLTDELFHFDGRANDFQVITVNRDGRVDLQITNGEGNVYFGMFH